MADEEAAAVAFFVDDEFLADEILARMPARCAVLSKRFRHLVASSHFWLRHRRLGPPSELPHIARLYRHDDFCTLFEFHVAGPASAAKLKHTLDAQRCWYAGTCNGLVLLSSSVSYNDGAAPSVDGVLFNPATKEEARLSLPLPPPHRDQNTSEKRRIVGFGYRASSKVYKALISEVDKGYTGLMVVSLDGSSDGQEPRTVFSFHHHILCCQKLHTADGKVYFLIFKEQFVDDIFEPEDWFVKMVLVFDVDAEVATTIAIPELEEQDAFDFTTMLEIRGRPCICNQNDEDDTVIWLLTPDHRWEQLYILVDENFHPDGHFAGAWDSAGGLVFTVFDIDGAYLYKLHEHVEDKQGGGNRLADLSSITVDYKWPEQFTCTRWTLLDYRPTLISLASVVGDVALSSRPHKCVEASVGWVVPGDDNTEMVHRFSRADAFAKNGGPLKDKQREELPD